MQDPVNKYQPIKLCHVALEKDLRALQISINRGPQPKGKGFREIQISFKTSSASKEALALYLSSSKEAFSKSSQASFIYT